MAVTSDFKGRLANKITGTWLENLGVDGAPLTGVTRAITDVDGPNSTVSIGLQVENSKGRTAQTLQKGDQPNANSGWPDDVSSAYYREYSEYTSPASVGGNYGKPQWSNFIIKPDFIEEGYQAFTESNLENLDDQNFIMNILREPLFEAVRQRVMMRFLQTLLNPHHFVDINASPATGTAPNLSLALKINAFLTDYDDFNVPAIERLYTDVRKRLLNKTGTLTVTLTPDLLSGIGISADNINWANYATNLDALKDRKYMQIKNCNFFETDLIDTSQDIQQDGLTWTAPAANFRFPTIAGQGNEDKNYFGGTGALTYANVQTAGGTAKAPTISMPIIGAAYNKRAVGMGIWRRWDASKFAGNALGVSTSFFQDPLTGVQFRVKIFHTPLDEKYHITCSAKVGFVAMDPRACTLILRDTT